MADLGWHTVEHAPSGDDKRAQIGQLLFERRCSSARGSVSRLADAVLAPYFQDQLDLKRDNSHASSYTGYRGLYGTEDSWAEAFGTRDALPARFLLWHQTAMRQSKHQVI